MAKLSEDRKNKLNAQKRRAIMKDIDKREAAEQEDLGFDSFRGLTAKRALQKAYKQNERADFENSRDLMPTYEGLDRDLINIKKYGDDAMRSKGFGSRASNTQNFSDGGSVERPRNKKVDTSIIEQGGVTPIRALTAALMNRRDRKEDRKYQESLKDMGMFEDGGGRANVSSSKDKMYMAPPKDMRKKFRDGGSVRGCASSQISGTGFSGEY